MIRALCGLNKTFDKDVTIVLALNRISALIGIFFGDALPFTYTLGACLLLSSGGYFRNFWVGMCRLDQGYFS